MKKFYSVAIIFIITLFSATIFGKEENSTSAIPNKKKTKPITIPKATFAPIIDGKLDEDVWKNAAVFKDFIQTNPGDNIPPSKPTEALMLYDKENLYIAFKCWDEKGKIRATVAKRDEILGEDNVRVWLDTYDDQRRAYVLGWNPLGVQYDGIFTEGEGADLSVDIVMESKGMIHDWGWSVEVKIPFKSLRYKAGKGKFWGFHAGRSIFRFNNEFNSWMPNDRNTKGFLIQAGKITGFDDLEFRRTLDIIPSVTISETGKRVSAIESPEGRFVNEPIRQQYGLNLKYTITPNVTLDVAINPDFAEIEADAPVITANERFPIFFPEKRPFFQEGVEIFQSPFSVYNSRSIVDPDFAAKLTGKIGKNSFGLLVASDNAPGNFDENSRIDPAIRPFIDEFVDKKALFAILRLKRDIGKENSLGFFGTARIFPEARNFVGGFDGSVKLNKKSLLQYQFLVSHSRQCFFDPFFDDLANPNQAQRNGEICGGAVIDGQQVLGDSFSQYRTGNGFAYFAEYEYSTDTFAYALGGGGLSRDYRADSGFTRRVDTHSAYGRLRKSTKSRPKSPLIRSDFNFELNGNFDGKGRPQSIYFASNFVFKFQKNTTVTTFAGAERVSLYEDEFGLARNANREGAFFGDDSRDTIFSYLWGSIRTQPSKRFNALFSFGYIADTFDFDFGGGPKFPRVSPAALANPNAPLDPGPGLRYDLEAAVELAPTDPFRISFNYTKAWLTRNDTKRTAFDTNIFSLRSTYQFTRFLFTRLRMDYNTLESNVTARYLFGWNPNPGTAFYVGYNDDLNYNGFSPFTRNREPGFNRNSRTFFIRMSYLFRKSF